MRAIGAHLPLLDKVQRWLSPPGQVSDGLKSWWRTPGDRCHRQGLPRVTEVEWWFRSPRVDCFVLSDYADPTLWERTVRK
ncbi:hypothetical protein E2C01_089005 [Portunus trituberculatus]|uniref:Uncharacterized protein n=1 Tax=Portunus trituberculatus TaxID=210409 RepID=A0A5B7JAU9_PORTR|nr:hypothetical protein [Portunus trituberculatus]